MVLPTFAYLPENKTRTKLTQSCSTEFWAWPNKSSYKILQKIILPLQLFHLISDLLSNSNFYLQLLHR